jgi:hypothetical protein
MRSLENKSTTRDFLPKFFNLTKSVKNISKILNFEDHGKSIQSTPNLITENLRSQHKEGP